MDFYFDINNFIYSKTLDNENIDIKISEYINQLILSKDSLIFEICDVNYSFVLKFNYNNIVEDELNKFLNNFMYIYYEATYGRL